VKGGKREKKTSICGRGRKRKVKRKEAAENAERDRRRRHENDVRERGRAAVEKKKQKAKRKAEQGTIHLLHCTDRLLLGYRIVPRHTAATPSSERHCISPSTAGP